MNELLNGLVILGIIYVAILIIAMATVLLIGFAVWKRLKKDRTIAPGGIEINGHIYAVQNIAFDRCHKIYFLKDDSEVAEAKSLNYKILEPKAEILRNIYEKSCSLRFINPWGPGPNIVPQGYKGPVIIKER